jgi:hypothetical protein
VLAASQWQQVPRPDEPLLPLGVEDAAGEGREDVPVGIGVDEGVTPQRALRRQCAPGIRSGRSERRVTELSRI